MAKTLPEAFRKMADALEYRDFDLYETPSEEYHVDTFWKKILINKVTPDTPANVLSATKKLCYLFIGGTNNGIVMDCAARLSAQLRDPTNPHSLIINPNLGILECDNQTLDLCLLNEQDVFQPNNEDKKNFLDSVDALTENNAVLWGPAFATLLVRMNKRSSAYVANKITRLAARITRFYPIIKGLSIVLPAHKTIQAWCSAYRNAGCIEIRKNTAIAGFIMAYTLQPLPLQAKELIDFLVIESVRYTGMPVVSLIDEVVNVYKINAEILKEFTLFRGTENTWNSYAALVETHLNVDKCKTPKDFLWVYAREFSPSVFKSLSYPKSNFLCNLLACVLDFELEPEKVAEYPELGPRYRGLNSARSKQRPLDIEDVQYAKSLTTILRSSCIQTLSSNRDVNVDQVVEAISKELQ